MPSLRRTTWLARGSTRGRSRRRTSQLWSEPEERGPARCGSTPRGPAKHAVRPGLQSATEHCRMKDTVSDKRAAGPKGYERALTAARTNPFTSSPRSCASNKHENTSRAKLVGAEHFFGRHRQSQEPPWPPLSGGDATMHAGMREHGTGAHRLLPLGSRARRPSPQRRTPHDGGHAPDAPAHTRTYASPSLRRTR